MSSQEIIDFLTKQLFIEKNIITYRSLSRQFSLHVNAAKNELATYHTNAPYQSQACSATYLLSGEVDSRRTRSDYGSGDVAMSYDGESNAEADEEDYGDEVPQMKITVVNEKDLEDAKAKYSRLDSVHVYSLSPSPIYDSGVLCTQTESIRETDNTKGAELAVIVGRIIGDNIQMKSGTTKKTTRGNAAAVAGPSKPRLAASKLSAVSAKPTLEQKEDEPKEKMKITTDKPKDKLKPSGKLEFKSKPKETNKEVGQPQKEEKAKKQFFVAKPVSRTPSIMSEKETEKEPARKQNLAAKPAPRVPSVMSEKEIEKEPPKRGVKRKSTANVLSDSEEESTSTSPLPVNKPSKTERNSVRVKKGVVLSDDDSDVPQTRRKPRAAIAVNSENEREAMALMDIDDDQVIKVTRETASANARHDEEKEQEDVKSEEPPATPRDEDVEMADDSAPAPKLKKKKEKKVVPIGSNGLKKKRVIKSRESVDAKGYTIMEDYSSYESMDGDEEPEPKPKAKGKAKTKASITTKIEAEDSDVPSAAPVKQPAPKKLVPTKAAPAKAKAIKAVASSKGGQQKGIAGFFGPAKAKK